MEDCKEPAAAVLLGFPPSTSSLLWGSSGKASRTSDEIFIKPDDFLLSSLFTLGLEDLEDLPDPESESLNA